MNNTKKIAKNEYAQILKIKERIDKLEMSSPYRRDLVKHYNKRMIELQTYMKLNKLTASDITGA